MKEPTTKWYTQEEITALSGSEIREHIDYLNSHASQMLEAEYRFKMLSFIDEINRRGERIAKKYKKKYRPLSYSELRTNSGFKK